MKQLLPVEMFPSFVLKSCLDTFPVGSGRVGQVGSGPVGLGRTTGTLIIELTQSSWAGAGTELGNILILCVKVVSYIM